MFLLLSHAKLFSGENNYLIANDTNQVIKVLAKRLDFSLDSLLNKKAKSSRLVTLLSESSGVE